MRKVWIAVAVAALTLSSAASCKRSEGLTGLPTGSRSLAGEVQPVGDLAGSSPSGINVSSNGQIAVTDGSGRFTFMSLPEKSVKLSFTRADGIAASATVDANASAVVVQLQKKTASVRTTGQSKREIEGLIEAVSEDSITVNDARTHGPVTAKIVESTVIRKGGTSLDWDDLDEGDRVHVKASVDADGNLTAFEIMLQNEAEDDDDDGEGDDGGQTKELEGLITAISADSISVNNASTHRVETAAITENTVIRKGNKSLEWDDLQPGNRVHVKTSGAADSLTALEIKLQN